MPLRNPFRRQDDAPTLRDRAADLSARLASAIRKPAAAPADEPESEAPGTIEEFAGLEFSAYTLDDPVRTPQQWADKFAAHAMMMHVADRTLRMTKPELIAFIRDAGEQDAETPEIMFRGIDGAQETFQGWSELLSVARARYIVAASAACTEPPAQMEAPSDDPAPSEPVEIEAAVPTDLADACLWAVRHRSWIDRVAERSPMTDAELDVEIAKVDAVISRAIVEPSTTPREIAAKAALALEDYERFVFTADTKCDDGERIVHTVLREAAGLTDAASVSEFRGIDFGPDTHIAELATDFCRVYGRHAVKDRAHMAGDLSEAEWLPSYRATVALMEKLEATRPKTLLGTALKSLGAIGLAGWNARADGSTDGMDVWERVGAQFQDALMADALAPISISGPNLVGLVNFQAATMEELRAVYEVADELGTAGHAQAWVGRSKVRGSSQDLNPAGHLAQWVGDALSDVVSTAISEARGRIPANDDDRRIRFEILARSIFQNDDPAGEAAFAREILASVER